MPESPLMRDGEERPFTSASGSRYMLKCVGGVYSCSCPGWRNQSRHPHYRTCKHLVEFRGARDEAERIAPGGRGSMPGTVSSLVEPYWPGSGAGLARDIETGRLPAPASARTPGGRSPRYAPSVEVRFTATKNKVAPTPPKKVNAWEKVGELDIGEEEPPPPPPAGALTKLGRPSGPAPVNDVADAKAAPRDEPEWETKVDASTPLDPAAIISGGIAPVAKGGAFRGVLLAQEWDGLQNVTGWVMSEKLDGVRAYWDGEHFYSRNGNIFSVPDWYKVGMPKDVHLDGEFWMGRGLFQKTSGFVRRMDRGDYWKQINYMIFDVPSLDAGFEHRIAHVAEKLSLPGHAKLLPHAACPSIDVLKTYLAAVEESGGEGVMLRQPGSRYVRTRSTTLLKVKTFFDTEAEVTGTTPGKGRHAGAVGALEVIVREEIMLKAGKKTCTIKAGTEFEVGTGLVDAQRRPGAIPVGSTITFRFQELSTEGIPRFPSLIAVRDYE